EKLLSFLAMPESLRPSAVTTSTGWYPRGICDLAFVRESRRTDKGCSPPILERSGPRMPPRPRIMWHSLHRPFDQKIFAPCAKSPGAKASDAVARRLRI